MSVTTTPNPVSERESVQLQIVVDRSAAARHGINVQDIQDTIEAATKGRVATEVLEGERRFELAVRIRGDGDPMVDLRRLSISAPSGERIPLVQLAEFVQTEGLAEVDRDGNVKKRYAPSIEPEELRKDIEALL